MIRTGSVRHRRCREPRRSPARIWNGATDFVISSLATLATATFCNASAGCKKATFSSSLDPLCDSVQQITSAITLDFMRMARDQMKTAAEHASSCKTAQSVQEVLQLAASTWHDHIGR